MLNWHPAASRIPGFFPVLDDTGERGVECGIFFCFDLREGLQNMAPDN